MENFRKIEYLREIIRKQELYIQELQFALSGTKAVNYDKDAVQTSLDGDPMLSIMIKIQNAETKLHGLKCRLALALSDAIEDIHQIDRLDYQELLYLIYIDGMSIRDASERLGWGYEYGKKQHSLALKNLSLVSPQGNHDIP